MVVLGSLPVVLGTQQCRASRAALTTLAGARDRPGDRPGAGAGSGQSTASSASTMPSPYRPLFSVVPLQVAFQSGVHPSSV